MHGAESLATTLVVEEKFRSFRCVIREAARPANPSLGRLFVRRHNGSTPRTLSVPQLRR